MWDIHQASLAFRHDNLRCEMCHASAMGVSCSPRALALGTTLFLPIRGFAVLPPWMSRKPWAVLTLPQVLMCDVAGSCFHLVMAVVCAASPSVLPASLTQGHPGSLLWLPSATPPPSPLCAFHGFRPPFLDFHLRRVSLKQHPALLTRSPEPASDCT